MYGLKIIYHTADKKPSCLSELSLHTRVINTSISCADLKIIFNKARGDHKGAKYLIQKGMRYIVKQENSVNIVSTGALLVSVSMRRKKRPTKQLVLPKHLLAFDFANIL